MNGTPRTVSDLFPSKWLKAEDLEGRPRTVRIAEVTIEPLRQPDGTSKPAAIVTFERATKRLILNKTQATALAAIMGSEVFDDWVGRYVMLKPATAQNGKSTIAVFAPPAQATTPAQANAPATGV